MLRGVGFTSEDFTKPFVGIASTGAKVTPCNMHINKLSEIVEDSINNSGGKEYFLILLQYLMASQWVHRE